MLPFTPASLLLTLLTVQTSEARPPSEMSQTGSSGYGSTRSQREKAAGKEDEGALKTTGSSLSKPVSVVKPSKDKIPNKGNTEIDLGPKTSTPIKSNEAAQSFSFISETGGSVSNLNAPDNFALTVSTFPKRNKKPMELLNPIASNNNNNIINNSIKLATVKPQRIASVSGGTLRPFRLPEGSRILFRSVRSKYGIKGWPSLPEVVAAAAAANVQSTAGDSSPNSLSLSSPPTVIISDRKHASTHPPQNDEMRGEGESGLVNGESKNGAAERMNLPSESEDSKLDAITIANTIANKNANKISGLRLNHPEHKENNGVEALPKPTISSKPTSINSIMTPIKPTSSDPRSNNKSTNPTPSTAPPALLHSTSRKRATNLAKLPPPLIGNKVIPPPPSLEEDEDEEEENGESSNSSNDDNNNATTNDQACLTNGRLKLKSKGSAVKPVPMPAPRIQTLTKSKGHVYQNIPFTKKTPRHEV